VLFAGCGYHPPVKTFRFSDNISFKIDEATVTQYEEFEMLNVRSVWLQDDPTEDYWIRITWSEPNNISPPELKSWYYKVNRKENESEGIPFMLEIKGPILSDSLLVTLESKKNSEDKVSINVPYGKPLFKTQNKG
jgi:hypothetical protein